MIHARDRIKRSGSVRPKRRSGEGVEMRTMVAALLGLIGGVIAGVVISEIIGIVGYLVFDSAVGIKFLPIYLAILFAVVALVVNARLQRRSEQPSYRRNQRSK